LDAAMMARVLAASTWVGLKEVMVVALLGRRRATREP